MSGIELFCILTICFYEDENEDNAEKEGKFSS